MDTAMEQQKLEEMLDRAVREVTRRTAGVELFKTQEPPSGDLCTVYITFKNGFQSSLTLWGNISLLARMARSALREEHLTQQDLEDFSKEYFNILCGKIAALLFQATKVPARFSVRAQPAVCPHLYGRPAAGRAAGPSRAKPPARRQ